MPQPIHVAIVGASGAVGQEMLRCLEERDLPLARLTLLASSRSAGSTLLFRGEQLVIEELRPDSFAGVDIALFSAGSSISHEFAPHATAAGAVVIDNSSAFRMLPEVPLVVPEINGADALRHQGIIANPNCTTIVTLMAIAPLHRAFHCTHLSLSSYQAVSGSGAGGIRELEAQLRAWAAGSPAPPPSLYPHPIAFNVIPQVDSFLPDGYTKEEMKLPNEARKILGHPDLQASATCVRVPVLRSHSVSATARFSSPVSPDQAREVLSSAPGVQLVDDPSRALYPTPLDATGGDDCLVGRIRSDLALDGALCLWIVGDQVRKGAALNAVQIAELLVETR